MKLYPLPGGMGGGGGRTCKNCPTLLGGNSICPACKTYNDLAGTSVVTEETTTSLDDVKAGEMPRLVLGGQLSGWDRVFGGGILPTAAVLLCGEPGAGKSTSLLQLASRLIELSGGTKWAYYISAEQAPSELKVLADRLALPNLNRFRVLRVMGSGGAHIDEETLRKFPPAVFILDSISALAGRDIDAQEAIAKAYKKLAVRYNAPAILVSHMVKSGDIAGTRRVEHELDALVSIWMSFDNEEMHAIRAHGYNHVPSDARALVAYKCRFAPTKKYQFFLMTETGLVDLPKLEESETSAPPHVQEDGDLSPDEIVEMILDLPPRDQARVLGAFKVAVDRMRGPEPPKAAAKLTKLPRQEAVEGEALRKKRPAMPRVKKAEKKGKVAKGEKSEHKK